MPQREQIQEVIAHEENGKVRLIEFSGSAFELYKELLQLDGFQFLGSHCNRSNHCPYSPMGTDECVQCLYRTYTFEVVHDRSL